MALLSSPNDLSRLLRQLPQPNAEQILEARQRQKELLKPAGSLGRLEDIAIFLAGWSQLDDPYCEDVTVLIFAGNHGVTTQGVSRYPRAVTQQLVDLVDDHFNSTAIQVLASEFGLDYAVKALDLETPTGDISLGPAMTASETLDAINTGAAAVDELEDITDLVILGEMGIGNTTIAAALAARSFGGKAADWVGPGTGLDDAGVANKAKVVERALALHTRAPRTAFESLMRVGGREQAALAGAILAARIRRLPVLLDGFVVGASLAPLFVENRDIVAHCIAGHVSAEPGHRLMLKAMGLAPLLDLGMRLGEASGAALALTIVRAAVNLHTGMTTFGEAGINNSDRDDA